MGTDHFATPLAVQFRDIAGGAAVVIILILLIVYLISRLFSGEELTMPKENCLLNLARIIAPAVTATQHLAYYGCTFWQWFYTKELAF